MEKINRKAKKKEPAFFRCSLCIDKKEFPEKELWEDKYYGQKLCSIHKAERYHEMTTAKPMSVMRAWAAENFTNEEIMEMERKYHRYDS